MEEFLGGTWSGIFAGKWGNAWLKGNIFSLGKLLWKFVLVYTLENQIVSQSVLVPCPLSALRANTFVKSELAPTNAVKKKNSLFHPHHHSSKDLSSKIREFKLSCPTHDFEGFTWKCEECFHVLDHKIADVCQKRMKSISSRLPIYRHLILFFGGRTEAITVGCQAALSQHLVNDIRAMETARLNNSAIFWKHRQSDVFSLCFLFPHHFTSVCCYFCCSFWQTCARSFALENSATHKKTDQHGFMILLWAPGPSVQNLTLHVDSMSNNSRTRTFFLATRTSEQKSRQDGSCPSKNTTSCPVACPETTHSTSGDWFPLRPNPHWTRACKCTGNSFDVACIQCEHSRSQQQVPFAWVCALRPVWIGPKTKRYECALVVVNSAQLVWPTFGGIHASRLGWTLRHPFWVVHSLFFWKKNISTSSLNLLNFSPKPLQHVTAGLLDEYSRPLSPRLPKKEAEKERE